MNKFSSLQEFGISKQQISDLRKNKDKILKFTDGIETSKLIKTKVAEAGR